MMRRSLSRRPLCGNCVANDFPCSLTDHREFSESSIKITCSSTVCLGLILSDHTKKLLSAHVGMTTPFFFL